MITFSLLIPSRERKQLLLELLDSIDATTFGEIETLVLCDNDDETFSLEEIATVESIHKRINLKFYWRDRTDNLNRDYYNYLAMESRGKYIIALNDDSEFKTYCWDTIAEKIIEDAFIRVSDRIMYVSFKCDDGNVGSFPCLTREAYQALGYFFNDGYTNASADNELRCLFELCGRCLHLDKVEINHRTHYNGRREQDALNRRLESLTRCDKVIEKSIERLTWLSGALGYD